MQDNSSLNKCTVYMIEYKRCESAKRARILT